MPQWLTDFLNEALKIIMPAALIILTGFMGWLVKKANDFFNGNKQALVVAETVKAVQQTNPNLDGPAKKALAVEMLAADKRVGAVPDTAIEAAVLDLPKPCPPVADTDPK